MQVKCDGREPCVQCVWSKRDCLRNRPRKMREKKKRAVLSTEYQPKIDNMEERVSALSNRLEQNNDTSAPTSSSYGGETHHLVPPSQTGSAPFTPVTTPASVATTYAPVPIPAPRVVPYSNATFRGESSMLAHTRFVSRFVERLLDSTNSQDSFQLSHSEAVDKLKRLASLTRPRSSSLNDVDTEDVGPTPAISHKLPPFSLVATLLKQERETSRPSFVHWLNRILTIDRLTQYCIDVYFTATHTPYQAIIVSSTLHSFLLARIGSTADEDRTYEDYARCCQLLLEATLHGLRLHLEPTIDTVHALLLGAFHAIGTAKSSLAWTLVGKAFELAQSLGLHRARHFDDESTDIANSKSSVFWLLYTVDKALSLRLGRAPHMHDYDIDAPVAFHTVDHGPVSQYFILWVDCARIQGELYEKLYSPQGISCSADHRAHQALRIVDRLTVLRHKIQELRDPLHANASSESPDHLYLYADDVVILSLLTLAQRAIPTSAASGLTFNGRCGDVAREALDCHQLCLQSIGAGNRQLLEVAILYIPFIPFVVVFCTVMETASDADLFRLQSFVRSLEPARHLSKPAASFFRLAQVLSNIARRFVEMRTQPSDNEMQAGFQIDAYLNALGLAPTPPDDISTATVQTESFLDGDPALLAGWVTDHQEMLSLLQNSDAQLFGTNFFQGLTRP
ncbi:hypothetical protein FH972_022731 [Carpinus fangiana]|uniref:Xylanolytic transcriptional activator regulatory domain-containing protein n=1 Tax=Carpinus fangiana TaxID=176857 RepID=A0A5N6KT26_9ROSI|nr:hypothetical protein FH972_022731 [Carpinus fangiana]